MNKERTSDLVVVGVVGESTIVARETVLAAIRASGATPEVLSESTVLSRGLSVDAIVFDLREAVERLAPLAASLDRDPRTRWLPRVVLANEEMTAGRLAPFGAATLVLSSSPPEELQSAVAGAVEQVRARHEVIRVAQATSSELCALEQALAAVEENAQTLSHDAKVLFGVVLGIACNLRDGLAGPVTEEQHRHLLNVIEASNDTAALLDRYVTALHRAAPKSSDSARAIVPRLASRRHNDLGELVRDTVALFEGVAAAKRIRLHSDGDHSVYAWCDAMQIKQALVNLVANALKFTPDGGSIEVLARVGLPEAARGGPTARREVEIVVIDTGPGIPESERARVLERGVRLERDRATPGTGVGLAIVREIAELHGGIVRIEDAPGRGAAIAIVFPADRRGRSDEYRAVNGSPTPPAAVAGGGASPTGRSEIRRKPQ